jgi:hypothetical protein
MSQEDKDKQMLGDLARLVAGEDVVLDYLLSERGKLPKAIQHKVGAFHSYDAVSRTIGVEVDVYKEPVKDIFTDPRAPRKPLEKIGTKIVVFGFDSIDKVNRMADGPEGGSQSDIVWGE